MSHDDDNTDGSGSEEAVRVFVRIRPLNKREEAEKQTIGWNFNETSMLEDTPNGQRVYAYDHCFGPKSTNQETYDIVGKPVVLKAMEGYNGTVFTYGQTGSGKTWTMRGCESDPGMMVLCIRDILEWVKSHPEIQYILRVAYLEVYNEEINDLLGEQGPASKNLKIVSEDAARGAVIGGLVEEVAFTAEDFMAIVHRGEASRSYASTNMNAESSRSHTIYRVSIEQIDKDDVMSGGQTQGRVSYLNLVDLAGSERQKSTKAEGKVLKEGSNINKSLLALGAVINKLGEASKAKQRGTSKPVFVNYRDSKLTRILRQSLGGNTLTSILCAVTPAPMHREETVSTLKFGQLCKSIKNQVKSNEDTGDKAQIKQYKSTIEDMRKQIEELMSGGGAGIHADPESALGHALKDKSELEQKVRSLENMLQGGSGYVSTSGSGGGGGESMEESARTSEKLQEALRHIAKLESRLDEYSDLDLLKQSIEEYEIHSREEINEDAAKLEREKQSLQNERYKLLRERDANDAKEQRIGSLVTNLDEKESKLRQLLGTMKEQQEQWQRSVTDLQRREDLVDDWQSNHRQREKKLSEVDALHERKQAELNKREEGIVQEEDRLKNANRELQEREQRLQVAQSRFATQESQLTALEDKLVAFENTLKKREIDSDIRDRELSSRRKEMESWDVLLREKDRKISVEQRNLDEREAIMRNNEEKARLRDADAERRLVDLRQSEAAATDQMELYTNLYNEALVRNTDSKAREESTKQMELDLLRREAELAQEERKVKKLQAQMAGIEKREAELNQNIATHKANEDYFVNVRCAQISARHRQEMMGLEKLVNEQIKIVATAQHDLKVAQEKLASCKEEMSEFENKESDYKLIISQLEERIAKLEEESGQARPSSDDQHTGGYNNSNHLQRSDTMDSDDEREAAELLRARGGIPNQSKANTTHTPDKNKKGPNASTAGSGVPTAAVNNGGLPQALDFNAHLRMTHKILYHILAHHNALPDKNMPFLTRPPSNKPHKTATATAATRSKSLAATTADVTETATIAQQHSQSSLASDSAELDYPTSPTHDMMHNLGHYQRQGDFDHPPPPLPTLSQQQPVRNSVYQLSGRRLSQAELLHQQQQQLQLQQQHLFAASGGGVSRRTSNVTQMTHVTGGTGSGDYQRRSSNVALDASLTFPPPPPPPPSQPSAQAQASSTLYGRRSSNLSAVTTAAAAPTSSPTAASMKRHSTGTTNNSHNFGSSAHNNNINNNGEDVTQFAPNPRTPTAAAAPPTVAMMMDEFGASLGDDHGSTSQIQTPGQGHMGVTFQSPPSAGKGVERSSRNTPQATTTTPQSNRKNTAFTSPIVADLSSIVKTSVRNGIPVTTVNLSKNSGIKRSPVPPGRSPIPSGAVPGRSPVPYGGRSPIPTGTGGGRK